MMAGSQWNTSTRAHRQGGEAEEHGADQHPNVWEGHPSFHIIDQNPRLADVCILQWDRTNKCGKYFDKSNVCSNVNRVLGINYNKISRKEILSAPPPSPL